MRSFSRPRADLTLVFSHSLFISCRLLHRNAIEPQRLPSDLWQPPTPTKVAPLDSPSFRGLCPVQQVQVAHLVLGRKALADVAGAKVHHGAAEGEAVAETEGLQKKDSNSVCMTIRAREQSHSGMHKSGMVECGGPGFNSLAGSRKKSLFLWAVWLTAVDEMINRFNYSEITCSSCSG